MNRAMFESAMKGLEHSRFKFVRFRNRTIGWWYTDADGFCYYMRMPRG